MRHIEKGTSHRVPAADLRRWLSEYPWLLVLDGLDEVPVSSNRDGLMKAVHQFMIQAAQLSADVLVVAASRPQGYTGEFSPQTYQHRWLLPLSPRRALHYARRLAETKFGANTERQERVLSSLGRAVREESVARLMQTPLQVTIMTTLVDEGGHPPEEPWNLFNDYYDAIYRRERGRDTEAAEILRSHRPDIDALHRRVGFLLQRESERAGRTDAVMANEHFAEIVRERLANEGHKGAELESLSKAIISASTERLVLLVSPHGDDIGFELRPFQEFMAAEALLDVDDVLAGKRLRAIAPVGFWREVFLFCAGKCFAKRESMRDTIHTICAELNEDEVGGTVLAGSQLALELLEDGIGRGQPKFGRLLTRIALRYLDRPTTPVHDRLAALHSSELSGLYSEEFEARLRAGPSAAWLTSWYCLLRILGQQAAENLDDLRSRYWPRDRQDRVALLKLLPTAVGPAVLGDLYDVLTELSPSQLRADLPAPLPDADEPTWLSAFRDLSEYYGRGDRLDVNVSLTRYLTPSRRPRRRAGLAGVPSAAPGWQLLAAGSRFAEDPSSKTLADVLALASTSVAEVDPFSMAVDECRGCPWPFQSCLAWARRPEDLLKASDAAAAGLLGDLEAWRAAEQRWLKYGLRLADLQYVAEHPDLPFDAQIPRVGCPLYGGPRALMAVSPRGVGLYAPTPAMMAGSWIGIPPSLAGSWIGISRGQPRTRILELLEWHDALPSSRARAALASWILDAVALAGFSRELESDVLSVAKARAVIEDAIASDEPRLFTSFVDAWPAPSGNENEWLDVLDYATTHLKIVTLKTSFRFWLFPRVRPRRPRLQQLAEALADDPKRLGIARFLSLVHPPGRTLDLAPGFLDYRRTNSPLARRAKLLLALKDPRGWRLGSELGTALAEEAQRTPEVFEAVREAVRGLRSATDPALAEVLQGLIRGASGSNVPLWHDALLTLESWHRGRLSRLAEPDVAEELGLTVRSN
jgi:hypothetical protein